MATRNVNLTDTLDRFVEEQVGTGEFQNASEVVRAGLRLLKSRAEQDQARLKRFQTLVQEGVEDLDAGRYEEVTDLTRWFDDLEAEVEETTRGAIE